MTEKTFLLGVGAQKSGTTWLARHLDRHPSADMGFTKEYHIFDVLYLNDQEIIDKYLRARLMRLLQVTDKTKPLAKTKHVIKLLLSNLGYTYKDHMAISFIANPDLYFDYFAGRLNISKGINLTGDISPSYAGLPLEAFRQIKHGFDARGVRTKVVFIMRDPVDRCISAVRHRLRNQDRSFGLEDEIALAQQLFKSPAFMFRGEYEHTISALDEVFDPEDIQYHFYENFFKDDALRKLSRHLSIDFIEGQYDVRENVSNTSRVIPEELKREIFHQYRDTYLSVAERFGQENVADHWESYAKFR